MSRAAAARSASPSSPSFSATKSALARSTVSGVLRSWASDATCSRCSRSAAQRASSDSAREARMESIAARTSFTSRTLVLPTAKSSSPAPTRPAASVSGAILREITRLARRATSASASALPAAAPASMRFCGLGSRPARSRETHCGRYSLTSAQAPPPSSGNAA